ncbi:hypothetical protein NP493_1156g02021 [Ridgeia piscesae]|uniref:Uncharacterized protein n=1 Tax=Ridgeia piscesae TaxID=27915 RepID=A0AAD9KGB8_RIDPI|nr:hypothetical protein NP493_1156g02021 [Ridgeia piscesae]
MFSISIITLFGYHGYLVSRNVSTLESFRPPVFRGGPDKNGFNLGKWGNFLEIFGENRKMWLLPVFSSCGDGVTYPTRVAQPPPSSYHTMESVQTPPLGGDCPDPPQLQFPSTTVLPSSYGDGVTYPVRTVDEDFDTLLGQRQRWMEEGVDERVPGMSPIVCSP